MISLKQTIVQKLLNEKINNRFEQLIFVLNLLL